MSGRIYDTARWRRVRKRQLAKEPLCVVCAALGCDVPASQVDHIRPISKVGAKVGAAFDPSNLQSLCDSHHSFKTNVYDKQGRDWSEYTLRGCDADGNPLDPNHEWNADRRD